MKKKMILFALAGSGGSLGASGLTGFTSAAEARLAEELSNPASAKLPNPAPAVLNRLRRVVTNDFDWDI
jgi:hypothetical protein